MGKGRVSKDQLHSLTTRNGGSTPKFWDSTYVYSVWPAVTKFGAIIYLERPATFGRGPQRTPTL